MNPRLARALRAAVSADLIGNVKQCRRFWDAAALGNHLVNGGPQLRDGLIDRAGLGKSWRRRHGRRSLVSGDLCISRRGRWSPCCPCFVGKSEFKIGVDGLPQMIQYWAPYASLHGWGAPRTPSRYGEDVWLCCNESVKGSRLSPSRRWSGNHVRLCGSRGANWK